MAGYQLVYVDDWDSHGQLAECWFSNCEPQQVWGDDWDDAPYEHNASEPSTTIIINGQRTPIKYKRVIVTGQVTTPRTGVLNTNYTVEAINQRQVPWLVFSGQEVYAGESYTDFIKRATQEGLDIFTQLN